MSKRKRINRGLQTSTKNVVDVRIRISTPKVKSVVKPSEPSEPCDCGFKVCVFFMEGKEYRKVFGQFKVQQP
jgi:hypothetical protein